MKMKKAHVIFVLFKLGTCGKNNDVGSKLKCPVFVASEVSGLVFGFSHHFIPQ
jgi:hypothetical protein